MRFKNIIKRQYSRVVILEDTSKEFEAIQGVWRKIQCDRWKLRVHQWCPNEDLILQGVSDVHVNTLYLIYPQPGQLSLQTLLKCLLV